MKKGKDSTPHTTDLVVSLMGQPAAAPHPVGELFQRERQQRQGVAAAGVGDQTSDEIIVEAQSGYPGGLFDNLAQRVGRQRLLVQEDLLGRRGKGNADNGVDFVLPFGDEPERPVRRLARAQRFAGRGQDGWTWSRSTVQVEKQVAIASLERDRLEDRQTGIE